MSSASVRLALFNSLYWSAVTFFVILATSVPVSALVVTWPAKTDSTVLKKELFPEEISPTIQSNIQPTWGDLTNQENIDVLDSCFSDYSMGLDLILQLFFCLHKSSYWSGWRMLLPFPPTDQSLPFSSKEFSKSRAAANFLSSSLFKEKLSPCQRNRRAK